MVRWQGKRGTRLGALLAVLAGMLTPVLLFAQSPRFPESEPRLSPNEGTSSSFYLQPPREMAPTQPAPALEVDITWHNLESLLTFPHRTATAPVADTPVVSKDPPLPPPPPPAPPPTAGPTPSIEDAPKVREWSLFTTSGFVAEPPAEPTQTREKSAQPVAQTSSLEAPPASADLPKAPLATGTATPSPLPKPLIAEGAPRLPAPIAPSSADWAAPPKIVQTSAQELGMPSVVSPPITTAPSASCPTCGRNDSGLPPRDFPSTGGGGCATCGRGDCVPGRLPCYPCESNTILGGFFCDLYQCVCCPDPCFEPKWLPLQDSAFFVDAARPQSQMKLGYDYGRNFTAPDRSEYFFARSDGMGKGPMPTAPQLGPGKVNYDELLMYIEAAVGGKFSTFISYPYLSIDPEFAPHAAGFGDMSIGTKTNIFDCELLLVSAQMKTTIPTGVSFKGLGTGHVSLEPSLLFALKLARDTYLQGQIAEWIPIGGDSSYEGSIFHSHASLNQVLCRILPDVPIIGTIEVNEWTFQHGNYTDPTAGPFQKSSGGTYVSIGPGLRAVICDRVDFGGGVAFAVTEQHFAQTLLRMEFRFRY